MNKKLLMFTLMALALLIMVAPAMAKPIGPLKSNNPHIEITSEGAGHLLPSGGVHEWMADTEMMAIDFMHALDASKAKIPNALNLTFADIMEMMENATVALEAENKWGYMSQDILVQMFILELMAEDPTLTYKEAEVIAEAMAAMWPEGMYVRFVNVGKYWYS